MDKGWLLIGVIGLAVLLIAFLLTPAESLMTSIPPTKAFTKITNGVWEIEADSYADVLKLMEGNDITITGDAENDEVIISAGGSQNLTDSFGTMIIGGNALKAAAPNATVTINPAGSLSCTKSGSVFTCKLNAITCPLLQGIKGVDANGNLFCGVI